MILHVVDDAELQLALAICLLHPNKNGGPIAKGEANLPDNTYRRLCKARIDGTVPVVTRCGNSYTVALTLRKQVTPALREELLVFVSQDSFHKLIKLWKEGYAAEVDAHKRALNTSFSATNRATNGMSPDSYPRGYHSLRV